MSEPGEMQFVHVSVDPSNFKQMTAGRSGHVRRLCQAGVLLRR